MCCHPGQQGRRFVTLERRGDTIDAPEPVAEAEQARRYWVLGYPDGSHEVVMHSFGSLHPRPHQFRIAACVGTHRLGRFFDVARHVSGPASVDRMSGRERGVNELHSMPTERKLLEEGGRGRERIDRGAHVVYEPGPSELDR